MQHSMNLTETQKTLWMMKRNYFYIELGRILRDRQQLLQKLEVAAVRLEQEADCELHEYLSQPRQACIDMLQLLGHLKHTMDSQRFLNRSLSFETFLEVLQPVQVAILLVSPGHALHPPSTLRMLESQRAVRLSECGLAARHEVCLHSHWPPQSCHRGEPQQSADLSQASCSGESGLPRCLPDSPNAAHVDSVRLHEALLLHHEALKQIIHRSQAV